MSDINTIKGFYNRIKEYQRETEKEEKFREEYKEIISFRNSVRKKLSELDANDSKKSDGRVDIKLFNIAYGNYGWQAASTIASLSSDNGIKYDVDLNSVNIEEQVDKMSKQKFGSIFNAEEFKKWNY